LVELQEEPKDGPARLLCADEVRSELPLTAFDVEPIEPACPVGVQQIEDLVGRKMVPVMAEERFHATSWLRTRISAAAVADQV
jgi:hypothetical protein